MKISLSWLKEHIDTTKTPEEIGEILTMVGLEVDAISYETADPIFEISLTPNLVHAASARGIARELAAAGGGTLRPPFSVTLTEKSTKTLAEFISVTVEDQENCPRYCCRVVDKVKVAPSPAWLKERIESAGMRSVNNVVDSTNFVMMELGQPLHAFDLEKIEGKQLIVRGAYLKEKITTLDGQEHILQEGMVVIASKKAPVAIAGVMGGQESEVSEQTTTVLLESAYFTPAQIRRTSKACAIQSAASYRFERGSDPAATLIALNRAADLIATLCQAEVAKGTYDSNPAPFARPPITLRLARVQKLLGISLSVGEIENMMERLAMKLVTRSNTSLTWTPPTYRHDITSEIDLIEEIARLYGYQKLAKGKKGFWRRGELLSSPAYLFESSMRGLLLKSELQEVITCDLISPKEAALIPEDVVPKEHLIHLLNPSSVDHSILRASLLPGLLTVVKHNLDHEVDSFRLFEVGRIHIKDKDHYLEPSMAALLLSGTKAASHWSHKGCEVDFYDVKGMIESLLADLKVTSVSYTPSSFKNFHPGRQAHLLSGTTYLGVMGEVHPALLQSFGIEQRVFYAEMNLEDLKLLSHDLQKMKPLTHFPASKRDWTLPLAKSLPIDSIFSLIKNCHSSLLESVSLIDIYENEKLGDHLIHATFRFCYRDMTKTISLKEVEKEHESITQRVLSDLAKTLKKTD